MPGDFNPLNGTQASFWDHWWKAPKEDLADSVYGTVQNLMIEQTYISERYKMAISLYENLDLSNLVAWQFSSPTNRDGPYQCNIVEQITDTLHAEIITNRTRPQFFTEGGDWLSQERADNLTSFADGLFATSEVHEVVAPAVALDALVFGTGIAKVWYEDGKICASRVFPHEVMVDDVAAALSPPRTMYHVKNCARDAVISQFGEDPKLRKLIEEEEPFDTAGFSNRPIQDIISVIEAWRLPTPGSKGRHVIVLQHGVLLDEEWDYDWFPFAFLRYKPRTKGFWGKGVPEILEGHQELVNDIRDKINAQLAVASPMLWVKPGSRLKESDWGNEVGKVIESIEMPQFVISTAVPGDLMQREVQETDQAGTLVGVNTLMMKSELPAGLNSGSGRALRIYNDTKSKRFMRFARDYETWHIRLCKLMIRVSDMVTDDGEDVEVLYETDSYVNKQSYKKIRLPENSYLIKAQPVNFLSDTPAGRLSDIEALSSLYPEEMKLQLVQLLNNPDLKSAKSFIGADEDAIQKACYSILRGEKLASQVAPTAYLNLSMALEISRVILLEAQTKDAPVERILQLEQWMEMVRRLQELAAPPAPPPVPASEGEALP